MERLDSHELWLERKIIKRKKLIRCLQSELKNYEEQARRIGILHKIREIPIHQLDFLSA